MRKKLKNMAVLVLSFALTGMILTGCGEGKEEIRQEPDAEISQENEQDFSEQPVAESVEDEDIESVENEDIGPVDKAGERSEGYEDNFAVDSEAAKEFAAKVKEITAKKDLEALAELTAFPVYVGLPDVDVVETREDFLNLGAETVFTEKLMKSVETADIEHFEPSMAGFSISDGGSSNINFGVVDGVLAINGINY